MNGKYKKCNWCIKLFIFANYLEIYKIDPLFTFVYYKNNTNTHHHICRLPFESLLFPFCTKIREYIWSPPVVFIFLIFVHYFNILFPLICFLNACRIFDPFSFFSLSYVIMQSKIFRLLYWLTFNLNGRFLSISSPRLPELISKNMKLRLLLKKS